MHGAQVPRRENTALKSITGLNFKDQTVFPFSPRPYRRLFTDLHRRSSERSSLQDATRSKRRGNTGGRIKGKKTSRRRRARKRTSRPEGREEGHGGGGRRVMLDEDEGRVECKNVFQRTCSVASAQSETSRYAKDLRALRKYEGPERREERGKSCIRGPSRRGPVS